MWRFGDEQRTSLVWTLGGRHGTLDFTELAAADPSDSRSPPRRLGWRKNYDLTSRLLLFVPVHEQTSLVLGGGAAGGKWWQMGSYVLVKENWGCDVYDEDPCDYDGRFEEHQGYYSVYVREIVVHGLVGIEIAKTTARQRRSLVAHVGPLFVVAREENPQYDYYTHPWGMLFGFSGTIAILEGGWGSMFAGGGAR